MRVKGFCPFCGEANPEVGPDAFLRCTNPECPDPDGVAEVLLDNEIHHIVRFFAGAWNAKHPLRERIEDQRGNAALLNCNIHDVITDHVRHGGLTEGIWRVKHYKDDVYEWEKVSDAT